jgi:dTDP-4-amino-4,6-dideoxygalactose transaminase
MSDVQARLGIDRLRALGDALLRRRAAADRYSEWLNAHGRTAAREPSFASHAFLRYPLRVRERDAVLADARRRGVDLGDWFRSPLHPVRGDLSRWGYRWGTAPVAERLTAEMVNLPTDVGSDGGRVHAIERLLEASVDRIV